MFRPSPFPEAIEAQWRAGVERALGGEPFETLVARSYDGVAIGPLYPAAAATVARPLRAQGAPWRIHMRLDHPDPGLAVAQARADLTQGADGLNLIFADSSCAFGFGLAGSSRETADRFYAELEPPPGAGLELECPVLDGKGAATLIEDWAAGGSGWTSMSFAFDPAVTEPAGVAAAALRWRERITSCFCADGRRVHAAGGSEAQELAFVLAGAVRALRGLEAAGASIEQARELVSFRLAADADFLLTIAKFRALRLLWARVEAACGLAPKSIRIQAETAWRMMTRRDPWTNVLRAGLAVSAAALGGADAITVLPFTQAIGLPDAAARRLARNTQLVLLHEAHLAKVGDPAGGSGAFEALTQGLCACAWSFFQDVEREGGLAAALANDLAQARIAVVRMARASAAARRFETIVGTSDHPDLAESPVAALGRPRDLRPSYVGLPLIRLAEPFEILRDRSDAQLAATGVRPQVFLAALGPVAGSGESVAFARTLFETGGLETIVRDGTGSAAQTAAAFTGSPARIACLCASPGIPEEMILSYLRALAAAKARLIYVSGRPGVGAAALRKAGVAGFLHPGCDALAILEGAKAGAA